MSILRMLSSNYRQPQTFPFAFSTSQNNSTHRLNSHFIIHAYHDHEFQMYQLHPTSQTQWRLIFLYNCETKSCGLSAFASWCSFIAITSMYSHRRQYNGTDCNVMIIPLQETISNQNTNESGRCIWKWNEYMQMQKISVSGCILVSFLLQVYKINTNKNAMFIGRHH